MVLHTSLFDSLVHKYWNYQSCWYNLPSTCVPLCVLLFFNVSLRSEIKKSEEM